MGSAGRHRVLVVEDDEAFRRALGDVLERDGRFAVVGEAGDGEEAVALAEELDPDAIVMDIELPLLDGVQATRAILRTRPDVPVVAISGHDYEERVLEIRDAGASDYVRKFRVEEDLPVVLAGLLARTSI
jgi:CheY-like chemotaxis protein